MKARIEGWHNLSEEEAVWFIIGIGIWIGWVGGKTLGSVQDLNREAEDWYEYWEENTVH